MKNIILLITDTFRYDNLGDRAEPAVRTPALDTFASNRATSIEKFYTGSFPTIPHRTDLTRGVLGWPHYPWQPIDVSGPNHAPQILKKAGYWSQLLCDCPHLFNARFQFGFDAAFQNRGQEGDRAILHMNDEIETVMPRQKTRQQDIWGGHTLVDLHRWHNRYYECEEETFASKTSRLAVRWLEENYQAGPFFLWVDFFDPHEPWDPPEYLVKRYDPDYTGTPMLHPNYGPSSDYTPEELRNLRAHYAAEAELVDRMVGRVLQKIDDLQLLEDSIVLVTSDHGFSIGEHARTGKTNIHPSHQAYWPIYPEVGHVPFLVAGPGIAPGRSLGLIGQPIDILPTLCDLAGAKVDPPVAFDGKSFADAVLKGGSKHRECAVSGCHLKETIDTVPGKMTTPFVVSDKWGYTPVGAAGKAELYDLTADPLAKQDVAADHAAECAEMQARLVDHMKQHGASEKLIALWARR